MTRKAQVKTLIESDIESFTNILKQVRKEAGLSQMELGEKIGLSRTKIQSLERGESMPRYDEIMMLCHVLNKPEYLFFPRLKQERDLHTERFNHVNESIQEMKAQIEKMTNNQEAIIELFRGLIHK
ncbi:hypothetical protein VCHA31O73_360016 [Vibrio chagasii]|nr:hypothetical protein VCHA31O73_360016 [Vibrio chagasii]